ncbi:MAG: chromosome segregation protein SMC [Bacteriovoracaceae bacterium]
MKLKRLIIQGFKSFKDRTTIHFDDGITGIVGPNGCGKSNIVDSLFWVMGEQSAKHLRGTKMKDLIFSGTSKYGPGGFAEASLILENTEGKHIHIGNKVACPSEIKITRKLYRNGETEYRLNDSPCRLKDVQEVFMDTGAGAKSYSIIAQGEIDRLVRAKPVDRRTIIEEVAGITKFKVRKKESARKMDQTEQNLGRLKDLRTEIDRQLKSLEAQAEKAMKAKRLRERIEKYELIVNSHQVFDCLKDLKEAIDLISEKKVELETSINLKDQIELGLEDERIKRDEKIEELETLQKTTNELSKELSACEERLAHHLKSLTEKEKLKEKNEDEKVLLEEEILERTEFLSGLKEKQIELDGENLSREILDELEVRLEEAKEEVQLLVTDKNEKGHEIEAQKKERDLSDRKLFNDRSQVENLSTQLEEISEEVEAIEAHHSTYFSDLKEKKDLLQSVTESVEELSEKEELLKTELTTKTEELKEKRLSERETSENIARLEAKKDALNKLNSELAGSKASNKDFIETHNEKAFSIIEQGLSCEEEYLPALKISLGPLLDYIIADKPELDFIASKVSEAQNLDFLVTGGANLGDESLERLKVFLGDDLRTLKDVTTITGEIGENLRGLLSHFVVVDQLNVETLRSLPNDLPCQGIIQKDGRVYFRKVAGAWALNVCDPESLGSSAIDRNIEIEKITSELEDLSVSYETLRNELLEIEARYEELESELDQLRADLNDSKAKKAELSANVEGLEKNYELQNSKVEKLIAKRKRFSEEKFTLIEEISSAEEKIQKLDEWLAEQNETLQGFDEALEEKRTNLEFIKEEFYQKESQFNSFKERKEALENQMTDIESQIERANGRLLSASESIEKYTEELEGLSLEIQELGTNNHVKAGEIKEQDKVISLKKSELDQMLQQMKEREDKVKSLTKEISVIEKLLVEKEVKINQFIEDEAFVVKDIFEKYRIDLRETLVSELELSETHIEKLQDITSVFLTDEENPRPIQKESYEFNRRYGQDLKDCKQKFRTAKTDLSRLGQINWQAVEEYERQKLRSGFLKDQEEELMRSLEDLQKAIDHIDQKSKERFKIAFEEVNTRFEKVFPIIFGGGSARLKITSNLDDPECGVDIIAQPPGKKMQNINLMSGGEKALTAVSLIFSIFLVKPSPFCLLDEVDAPLDDANVGRFNELLREMSGESQFILITHNKKTMELNDTLYGVTMQEPGVSKAVSVQLQ